MRRNSVQTANLESDMLKRVRSGNGISRLDLARTLGLSASTVGVYVERLLDRGFLTESSKTEQEMGRPPKLLHLNPNGGEFIGVDFEARNILATAVNFSDKPLRHAHKLIEEGDSAADVIAKIQEAIVEVMPPDQSRPLAIGVGVPGIVDSSHGIAVQYKYIPNWQNVPLAASLERRFRVPVYLENTMRAMALAELWFGQGRGYDDFLCVCVRSGIGVGMVLNGRLHSGGHFSAGELGRWPCHGLSPTVAPFFAAARDAGRKDAELQEIASARSIQKALQKGIAMGQKTSLATAGQTPSIEEILHAAQQKDPFTLLVIGEAAKALGTALGHLSLAVDPVKIILAGQLTPFGGKTFLQPLRDTVASILRPTSLRVPEIVNTTMGEYIGALGAAALAVHKWKPEPSVAKAGAKARPAARATRVARNRAPATSSR